MVGAVADLSAAGDVRPRGGKSRLVAAANRPSIDHGYEAGRRTVLLNS
jgi:hypothetical protein